MTTPAIELTSPREAVASWTPQARAAWRSRVTELVPPASSAEVVERAERRAFAEISPEGRPWGLIVAERPAARRRRFDRLAALLSGDVLPEPMDERRAFLAVAAEDDPPGLELRDLVESALAMTH
jgi:hypothetical protein